MRPRTPQRDHAPRRRRAPRRLAHLALMGVPLALAGCGGTTTVTVAGGPGLSTSSASSTSTATGTGSTSATSTAPVGPVISLIWVVQNSTGGQIRKATPGGGSAHTIASIGPEDHLIAAGAGRVVVLNGATHQFRLITIADGSSVLRGSYAGQAYGGALSPDGIQLAFVDSPTPLTGDLKLMTLSTGAITTLRHFSTNAYDVPATWSATGIGAVGLIGASDAPVQGAFTLNASSGARIASSPAGPGSNIASIVVTGDAAHALTTSHSALGDDADATGGPGPQGPFNTLALVSIGGSSLTLLQQAHHNIGVLASLPGGDKTLVDDGSAAGGFAGISLSPDFGLLVITSTGARTQYAHYGPTFDSGAFYQDGTTVVVTRHDTAGATLEQYAPGGGAPVSLDTVAGGQFSSVYLVAG